ncbi:MAG: beta-propeller domain-containing protein [Phycisphaerales bacterium]|nr:beta-propeller domain-containing protein [Phycisphaerales bacterium]
MSRSHPISWMCRASLRAGRVVGCALIALALAAQSGCDTTAQQSLNGGVAGENATQDSSAGAPAGFGAPAPAADPLAPGLASDEATSGDVVRDIEEADVVKVVGDKLYALNQYKGLLIVDVADPDAPALLGSLDLRGRGVEMYVVGDRVFVLLSADYYYAYYEDVILQPGLAIEPMPSGLSVASDGRAIPAPPEFEGSQLAIVDVSTPTTPKSEGKINLVGYASQSRRVGDVIYVIGSNLNYYGGFYAPGDEADKDQGFVASINVADPADPQAVERKVIPGDGQLMHVTDTAIYAAGYGYDNDTGEATTDVQIVDISDAGGAIALRGTFRVPGSIDTRFYMDAFDKTFRIVTESWGFGFQQVRLFTYDITDPDDVQSLAEVQVIEGEGLEAVRFDGVRGYAVTFLRVDPLFVLDLSDPADPKVAGELEVPGFSTHIEPRGDRLIAVGIDDTDGNRPAVAYYDVSDPANPTQLGRVVLGPPGSYTSSEATYDEKAFKVLDDLGLIVIPFHHEDYPDVFFDEPVGFAEGEVPPTSGGGSDGASTQSADSIYDVNCTNGVQLVDFSDTALEQRGMFENVGEVNRVGLIGDRVFALSAFGLQTVDITDRDNPKVTGKAMFFDDTEMDQVSTCYGYYYGGPIGIDPGVIDNTQPVVLFFDAQAVQAILNALNSCGAVPGATALMIPASMLLLQRRIRRRRSAK